MKGPQTPKVFVLAMALAASAAAQEPSPPPPAPAVPTFGATAEAVTVDVVVLDKEGRPVTGLKRGDFVLSEDGRPQEIVGFEPRVLAAATGADEAEEGGAATNERGTAAGGRTLVFLVDDLGIDALHMEDATRAISRWLSEGADRRDAVTLVATSGDVWWSDRVGEGRADLQAVLGRLKGRKAPAATVDAMSDYEAYSIGHFGTPMAPDGALGPGVFDRVVARWLKSGACIMERRSAASEAASIGACRNQVGMQARQLYESAAARGAALLGAVERVSTGLSGARGRKSVIVLSQGLLRDTDQHAFERAVDASRRGNTAVSFVDVRGLMAAPLAGAGQRYLPQPADVGAMTMETTLLETEGGENLAETTGGSMVRNTNDIAGGVRRLADESAAYYLIGYQPERRNDGRWRKLAVTVARPGVTVRARRGYFATGAPPALLAEKNKKDKKEAAENLPGRALDPALGVGGARDQIPLRMRAHVLERDAAGSARVLVALEVGTASVSFAGTGAERSAQLDITVLGVSRDQAKTVPVDTHITLGADALAAGGWSLFSRELRLPPGPAQVRGLVRDAATGRSGLVTQRLEIPSGARPYISTPILSDRVRPPGASGQNMVVAAHRRFAPHGPLYCTYEVFPAPGRTTQAPPHVEGSFRLEDAQGRPVAESPPSPIAMTKDARFVRMVTVPLDGLAPGRYRLVVEATDPAAGLDVRADEVFFIEEPAAAAGGE